jgi:hypothetical protein
MHFHSFKIMHSKEILYECSGLYILQDSESEEDSDDRGSRGRRRGRNAGGASASRSSRYRDEPSLKKRLHALAKCLIDYVVRQLSTRSCIACHFVDVDVK